MNSLHVNVQYRGIDLYDDMIYSLQHDLRLLDSPSSRLSSNCQVIILE